LPHKAACRGRGFTLIEVLVVMTIMAIMVGVATLSIDLADDGQRAENEANRLAQLLRLQCEEAILLGQELGLRLQPESYRFVRFADQTWEERVAQRSFQSHQLADGLRFQLSVNQAPIDLDDSGAAEPHIICHGSGEMTPFELTLAPADGGAGMHLAGHLDGALDLER